MLNKIILWLAKKLIEEKVRETTAAMQGSWLRAKKQVADLEEEIESIKGTKEKYETLLADKGRMYQIALSMHRDMARENLFILKDHDGAAIYSLQALLDNCLGKGSWAEGNIITMIVDVVAEDPDDTDKKE